MCPAEGGIPTAREFGQPGSALCLARPTPHSLDGSGEAQGSDARRGKAQGVHVSHMLQGVVEGLHIVPLQGEQGLRGVHVDLGPRHRHS